MSLQQWFFKVVCRQPCDQLEQDYQVKVRRRIRFSYGEEMPLWQLDDGTFACPICGAAWLYPAFSPVSASDDFSSASLGDVCGDCDIEIGYDEGGAFVSDAPVGWMHRQYAELRTRWLDQGGWSKEQLTQLEHNLGIKEAQARADAQRLKSGDWKL